MELAQSLLLLLVLLLLSLLNPSLADRYISRIHHSDSSQEYYDPTIPPPLPTPTPTPTPCSTHPLFTHSFNNTYNLPPFSTPYSPPPTCPSPWSHIALSLSLSSSGNQYDRIAALWLGSSEILRTSTAEPTDAGIYWHVTKDVTRYSSLLQTNTTISMMLENIVNDEFTAAYHVNATLHFYKTAAAETGPPPADLILPISNSIESSSGFWFRIMNASDPHSTSLRIPTNAYKAVLELYVSFHGNDEFWYSNPPNSYIESNHLTTGRGNGAFRSVSVTIDGRVVGSVVPFPVVFTGGINPLFWEPVVALGAFDLPTYDLDVTPFLGVLLDGESHEFGLRVADGISFWLVDANLHLWLDSGSGSGSVTAKLTRYWAGSGSVRRKSEFRLLDGKFKIKADSECRYSGWVNSSLGNLTTDVRQEIKFKNTIEFKDDGNYKKVYAKTKMKTEVKVTDEHESVVSELVDKYKFPLLVTTATLAGENNTYTMTTNLSHALFKESSLRSGGLVVESTTVNDRQDADGWMLVQDHDVLSGSAGTQQSYQYRYDDNCYNRKVSARDGEIVSDLATAVCSNDDLEAAS